MIDDAKSRFNSFQFSFKCFFIVLFLFLRIVTQLLTFLFWWAESRSFWFLHPFSFCNTYCYRNYSFTSSWMMIFFLLIYSLEIENVVFIQRCLSFIFINFHYSVIVNIIRIVCTWQTRKTKRINQPKIIQHEHQ